MIHYDAVPDKLEPGAWRVEGINYKRDGEVYVAVFTGPEADVRALEYASFKNKATQILHRTIG